MKVFKARTGEISAPYVWSDKLDSDGHMHYYRITHQTADGKRSIVCQVYKASEDFVRDYNTHSEGKPRRKLEPDFIVMSAYYRQLLGITGPLTTDSDVDGKKSNKEFTITLKRISSDMWGAIQGRKYHPDGAARLSLALAFWSLGLAGVPFVWKCISFLICQLCQCHSHVIVIH
jgi:hypothetical protein